MILDIQTAREALRIDGEDNDPIITELLYAIPYYIEQATGYTPTVKGDYSPLARTAARFILQLWYFGEHTDIDKIGRVIENLLKALCAERAKSDGV